MLSAVGTLYVQGVKIDWQAFDRDYPRRRLSLPTYPFQRERHWIENSHSAPESPGLQTGHPLLGRSVLSPRLTDVVHEVALGAWTPAYLNDHRVFGAPVFPATGYFEAVRAALAQLSEGEYRIEEMAIEDALVLPETGTRTVQLILSPIAGETDAYAFEFHSLDDSHQGRPHWRLHAAGTARAMRREATAQSEPQLPLLEDCEWKEGAQFYSRVRASGLEYGESFRGIARIRAQGGDGEAEVRLPEASEAEDRATYWLHPAIFDAGLQTVLACLPQESDGGDAIHLPVGFRRVYFHGSTRELRTARARVKREGNSFSAEVELLDGSGQLLVSIHGLTLRPIRRAAFGNLGLGQARSLDEWLYRQVWQAKALAAPALAATRTPIRLSTSELSARAASRWKGLSEQHSLSGYDTLAPQLDALSAGYVLAALKGLGWELTPGQRRRADTLADELKVVPAHRQMFHRALEMLQEDGVLLREGAFWIVPRVPPAGNPVRLSEQLMKQWPLNGAEISMTARCGAALAAVFSGKQDPIELLFPAGSLRDLEAIYHRAPFARVSDGDRSRDGWDYRLCAAASAARPDGVYLHRRFTPLPCPRRG
jgi:acyl transferase domain-containing protein